MAIKRMTTTEKQTKLLSAIPLNTFYHTKELEKLAHKLDIRSPAKEIIEYLSAENLLKQEKIGISNIFWRKPTNHSIECEKLQSELDSINNSIKDVEQEIENTRSTLENREYMDLINKLEELRNVQKSREISIEGFITESEYNTLKVRNRDLRLESNAITDRVFDIVAYLKKGGRDTKDIYRGLDVPDDLDYL